MLPLVSRVSLVLPLLLLTACPDKGDGGTKTDGKAADGKAPAQDGGASDEGEASLVVAAGDDDIEGPVPPQVSMVVFSIEGALMPVACFDQTAGSIKGGKDCLSLVKEGDPVRLDAGFSNARNKKAGGPVEPTCMAGEGKAVALSVEGGVDDANYKYASLPPSGVKIINAVKESTMGGSATTVDDHVKAKLLAAMQKDRGSVKGEVLLHQVAEVDLDGNPNKDVFYSAFVRDPKVIEQYLWSGIFVARDGDLDALTLVEKSDSRKDVYEVRATLNLDGKGDAEIWMRLVWAEGGGDRLYTMDGKPKPIGAWTCGAAKG